MEEATITLYKINKCGYYKRGETTPEFCNELEMLKDLKDWSNDLELEYTALHQGSKDTPPVYLFNIDSSQSGHYLITTWNEVHSTKSGVPSVDKSSKVGNAAVFSNSIKNNSIPGYPTYFLFFPKESLYATICINQIENGQRGLQSYLENFLSTKAGSFVSISSFENELNENIEVNSYRRKTGEIVYGVWPYFRANIFKKMGQIPFLLTNYQRINSIITKNEIEILSKDGGGKFSKIAQIIRLRSDIAHFADSVKNTMRIDTKIPISFKSKKELQETIDDWSSHRTNSFDDCGFSLKNDSSKIYWLSQSLARGKFKLDVSLDSNGIVDNKHLFDELNKISNEILDLMDE